jgi:microcystin-dependent protein
MPLKLDDPPGAELVADRTIHVLNNRRMREWATAIEASVAAVQAFPVGSIFVAVVSTNPATLLGYGTWSAFGTGRTLVGIDSGQAEFDTVEETGGAKTHTLVTGEIPSHDHGGATGTEGAHSHSHAHTVRGDVSLVRLRQGDANLAATGAAQRTILGGANETIGTDTDATAGSSHSHTVSAQGGGGAHQNLQPYIVVYMWKRTA